MVRTVGIYELPPGRKCIFRPKKCEKSSIFATSSLLWVEENASTDDIFLVAAQAGPQIQLGDDASLTVGGGYYYYSAKYDGADWAPIQGFVDLTLAPMGHSAQVYGDVLYNHKADKERLAWIAGAKLGNGPLTVGYAYRRAEANSVPDKFSHSDFANGETDAKGHTVSASVKLAPKVTLDSIFQLNERAMSSDVPLEFKTLQFNLSVKF